MREKNKNDERFNKMNKKLLTILLLCIFTFEPLCLAEDVIIIDSNGRARYEDSARNVKQEVKADIKGIKINSISNLSKSDIQDNEHRKVIRQANKVLKNYQYLLGQYDYAEKDKSQQSKKEYIKLELLDGDYVVWFLDSPYASEYHHDKTLMGLVRLEKKSLKDNKKLTVFYEYRIGYNTKSNLDMGLKHILFLEETNSSMSQYIYNENGKLLCKQTNDEIYIADDARNMLPIWSNKNTYNKTKISCNNFDGGKLMRGILASPFWLVGAVTSPVGIGIPLMFIGSYIYDGNDVFSGFGK